MSPCNKVSHSHRNPGTPDVYTPSHAHTDEPGAMAAEALAVATAAAPHHTDNGSQGSTSNGFLVAAGPPSSSLRPHHAPAPADRAARWTAKGDPSVTLPPAPPPPIPPPHNNNSNHSSALNANSSFSSLLAKAGLVGGGAESAPPTNAAGETLAAAPPPPPAGGPSAHFGAPPPPAGGAPGFSQWNAATVFAADQWVYRDPQGVVQGPFTKVDILDWFEGGFLPQVRCPDFQWCWLRYATWLPIR